MATWTPFPHPLVVEYDATSLKKQWRKLHLGDQEALPKNPAVLEAWVHFHNGDFHGARQLGLAAAQAGEPGGIAVANKATCIYATYLEKKEKSRLDLFMEVAQRAEARAKAAPADASAWYSQAYALGRYSQGISVAKALAQGLGGRVKEALEKTLQLSPHHAEAHIALGAFHAEVIDKVGALIGSMTYGARKEVGLKHFLEALKLQPRSAIALIEYANALVMLEGDKRMIQATELYQQAASLEAADAMEMLDIELAKAELED
jgi:tetratricopeptide (TPR) repeat protein